MSFAFVALDHNMPYNVSYTILFYFIVSLTRKEIHPTTPKLMTKKAFASNSIFLVNVYFTPKDDELYFTYSKFRMPLKPTFYVSAHKAKFLGFLNHT